MRTKLAAIAQHAPPFLGAPVQEHAPHPRAQALRRHLVDIRVHRGRLQHHARALQVRQLVDDLLHDIEDAGEPQGVLVVRACS